MSENCENKSLLPHLYSPIAPSDLTNNTCRNICPLARIPPDWHYREYPPHPYPAFGDKYSSLLQYMDGKSMNILSQSQNLRVSCEKMPWGLCLDLEPSTVLSSSSYTDSIQERLVSHSVLLLRALLSPTGSALSCTGRRGGIPTIVRNTSTAWSDPLSFTARRALLTISILVQLW